MAKKKSVRRRMRRIPQEGVRPFCYMLYEKERWTLHRQYDKETGMFIGYKDVLNMHPIKRKFESHAKCIAWLTRVKLNIDREERIWTALRACKIVEGWYTKTGKEIVTKEYELPDERTSVQRQRSKQRQLCQRRQPSILLPEAMGSNPWAVGGSSWTVRTGSTTTTVDTGWTRTITLPATDWITSTITGG